MQLAYSLFDRGEANTLAEFLASEEWSFHAGRRLTPASAHARRRGLGTSTVRSLTTTLFGEFTDLNRIEATTRQDNFAMRRVLVKCGFVKEAHYRQEWPSDSGKRYDSIGYGILRSDWDEGVTTPVNWDDGP